MRTAAPLTVRSSIQEPTLVPVEKRDNVVVAEPVAPSSAYGVLEAPDVIFPEALKLPITVDDALAIRLPPTVRELVVEALPVRTIASPATSPNVTLP